MLNQLDKSTKTKTTLEIKKKIDKISAIYPTISKEEQVILADILLKLNLLLEIKTLDTNRNKKQDKDIIGILASADKIIKLYK